MAAGRSKENLKTYVLCSGVTYGNGEDSLYDIIEVCKSLTHRALTRQRILWSWLEMVEIAFR